MQTHAAKLLTVEQAAKAIGLSRWRMYDIIKRGDGPTVLRSGRSIWINEAVLVEWSQRRTGGGAQ